MYTKFEIAARVYLRNKTRDISRSYTRIHTYVQLLVSRLKVHSTFPPSETQYIVSLLLCDTGEFQVSRVYEHDVSSHRTPARYYARCALARRDLKNFQEPEFLICAKVYIALHGFHICTRFLYSPEDTHTHTCGVYTRR